MLVMRFLRVGKKNQPAFKIVVTDKRNPPRGGRFTEEVGSYNPLTKTKVLKKERIQYWLSQGVQPSPTVHNLLVKEGIVEGKKIPVHKKSKKPAPIQTEATAAPAPAAAAEVPVAEVPVAEVPQPVEVPIVETPVVEIPKEEK